jgi:hypothetical protein
MFGAMNAGGLRPSMRVGFDAELHLGRWTFESGLEALLTKPGGPGLEGAYSLDGSLLRKIPVPGEGAVGVELGLERDDILGKRVAQALRAIYASKIVDRPKLEVGGTAGFGVLREKLADGRDEVFPSPAFALTAVLKPRPLWELYQKLEVELNLMDAKDVELASASMLAYRLTNAVRLGVMNNFKWRGDPVPGRPQLRNDTTAGVLINLR